MPDAPLALANVSQRYLVGERAHRIKREMPFARIDTELASLHLLIQTSMFVLRPLPISSHRPRKYCQSAPLNQTQPDSLRHDCQGHRRQR